MFDYNEAFSRNLGWSTPQEQQQPRHKRVAIAGMGDVEELHLPNSAQLNIITDIALDPYASHGQDWHALSECDPSHS